MKAFALLLIILAAGVTSGQTLKTTTIKLYFANEKLNKSDSFPVKVFSVTRKIPKTTSIAKAALELLFAGPTEAEKAKGYYSDFSEETKSFFISVNVKNKAAYVNLRDPLQFPTAGNFTTSSGGSNFFGQVEKTLLQFPSIKKIFYAIEGDPAAFYDWMQVGECPKELKNCDGSNFIK